MSKEVEVSAIVPVTRGARQASELVRDYIATLESMEKNFEVIVVIDGEQGTVAEPLEKMAVSDARIRVIRFARSFGDAVAIAAGFRASTGGVVLTLPAWYQVESESIKALVESLEDCDVSIGYRKPTTRTSGFAKFRRNLFHWLIRASSGESFSDLGCAARAFKRKVLEEIPVYGDQHIFLPLLASKQGFRVKEVEVPHLPSDQARSRSSIRLYLQRAIDILAVVFLIRFTKRPIRLFGMIGSITFVIGALFLTYLVGQKVFFGVALADRPALLVSSLLTVLGLQIFALGLLGELIIFTHARDIKEYTIEEIVN